MSADVIDLAGELKWDENGLIPVVTQDAASNRVLTVAATCGRSPAKKIASPTTGPKVQQTLLGDRARQRNLRSGRSWPRDVRRHQGPTARPLVKEAQLALPTQFGPPLH